MSFPFPFFIATAAFAFALETRHSILDGRLVVADRLDGIEDHSRPTELLEAQVIAVRLESLASPSNERVDQVLRLLEAGVELADFTRLSLDARGFVLQGSREV